MLISFTANLAMIFALHMNIYYLSTIFDYCINKRPPHDRL